MTIKRYIIGVWLGALSLVVVLALSSCTKEQLPQGGELDGGYKEFSLELTPPGAFIAASRAVSLPNQNAINRVEVFVFKNGNLFDHPTNTVKNSDGGMAKSVKMTLKTSQSESDIFDIMVIANAPVSFDYAPYKTKETLRAALSFSIQDKWEGTEFMMYGEALQTLILPTTNNFKIQMLRSLARVDIGVGTYNETSDSWVGLNRVFLLTEVRLVNRRDKFALIPATTILNEDGKVTVSTPTIPQGTAVKGTTADDALKYTDMTDANSIKSTIFLAEAPNDVNRVTLLVAGKYKGSQTATYYRIDMCVPNANRTGYDYLNILRNHLYRISITDVVDAGFSTPQAALTSAPINITATLTPVDEGGWGDIIFDGNTCLMSDVSKVLIYGEPNGVKSYKIATVKAIFAPGTVVAVTGDGIKTPINLLSGVATTISAVLPAQTTSGTYTLKVGRLTKVIQLTVEPAVDAHFDFLPFINVASITVEAPEPWLTLSQNTKYVKKEQKTSQIVGNSEGKACFHFDENIATSGAPRIIRALVHRNNISGTTGVVFEQLNLSGMVLGYFGAGKDAAGYTKQLAVESVEESNEREYDDPSIRVDAFGIPWGFNGTFTGATDKVSGRANTITLARRAGSGVEGILTIYNNYAARYCYDKNRGTGDNGEIQDGDVFWYLPAHNQLIGMWIANSGMTKPLTSAYWSATEYYQFSSWNMVVLFKGYVFNHTKEDVLVVRCVRDL